MKQIAGAVVLLAVLAAAMAGCQKTDPAHGRIELPPSEPVDQAELPGGEEQTAPVDGKTPDSQRPTEDRSQYLGEPPGLTVRYDGQTTPALQGTHTWTHTDETSGEEVTICADALHPLNCQEYFTPIVLSDADELSLEFELSPSSMWVCYWPGELLGSKDYEQYEAKQKLIALNDDGTLTLPEEKEGYVFQVYAQWDDTYGYGESLYSFLMEKSPA